MAGIDSLFNTKMTPTDAAIPIDGNKLSPEEEKKQEEAESQDAKVRMGVLQMKLKKIWQRPNETRWGDWEQQYVAATEFNDDGTANINRPLEKATIRNKMADELSMKPVITLKPRKPSDIYKLEILKKVWDFVWTEADTDANIKKITLAKNIFGTAWWYEGLEERIYTRNIPEIDADGKVNAKKVIENRSWLGGKLLDIRDVWIEPVSDMNLVDFCFIRERELNRERLKGLKNDPNFKCIDEALALIPATTRAPEFQTETERTRNDAQNDKYCLWHFFCVSKGQYIVAVGNVSGSLFVEIRNGANPFAHGELPISPCVDHELYMEIYGYGECELLETSKYELNAIENQMIDYVRESNTTNLLLGDNVAFQDSELVGGVMRLWNLKGSSRDVQIIKPPSMDGGLDKVREMIETNATIDTGIDNRSLAGNPTGTAYEARLQEQSKLKGVNVSMMNRDVFFQRVFRQRLSNIQQFLPTTTGKHIAGDEEQDSKFRSIPIEDTVIQEPKNIASSIRGKTPTLKPQKGVTSFFELKPSVLKNSIDIEVETPTTSPILRELDKQDKQKAFTEILNMAAVDPNLIQELDMAAIVREKLTDYNVDPDDFMNSKQAQDPKDIRQQVLQDVPQPPMARTQPQRQLAPSMPPQGAMPQGQIPIPTK